MRSFSSFQYQPYVEPPPNRPEATTESRWHQPWSEPKRFRRWPLMAASGWYGTLGADTTENVTVDKWFEHLSEPKRFKQGLRSPLQQPLAMGNIDPVVSFSWYAWLSEPKRFKIGLPVKEQRDFTTGTEPVVSFAWFNELKPPRTLVKRGILPGLQQTLAFNPQPFVSFGWYGNLSEPVRFKRGLRAPLQQFFTTDTAVIPTSKLTQWFGNLSEPVRFKQGLRSALQQTTAWPPKLLPTPTITATLDATETKDAMVAGVRVWNQVTSAEIGVIDTSAFGTEIGVVQAGPTGTIASVKVSIRIV